MVGSFSAPNGTISGDEGGYTAATGSATPGMVAVVLTAFMKDGGVDGIWLGCVTRLL